MKTLIAWAILALIVASSFMVDAGRMIHNHFALYLVWLLGAAGLAVFLALFSISNKKRAGEDE